MLTNGKHINTMHVFWYIHSNKYSMRKHYRHGGIFDGIQMMMIIWKQLVSTYLAEQHSTTASAAANFPVNRSI